MNKRVRKLMERNDGMTLVEVITALVLFTFVFMILLYGINMALKVMGNAQNVSEATQKDASKLETFKTALQDEGDATLEEKSTNTIQPIAGSKLTGKIWTASFKKSTAVNDTKLSLFDSQSPDAVAPMPLASNMPADVPVANWKPWIPCDYTDPTLGDLTFVEDTDGKTYFEELTGKIKESQMTGKTRLVSKGTIKVNQTTEEKGTVGQLFLMPNDKKMIDFSANQAQPSYKADFFYLSGEITYAFQAKCFLEQSTIPGILIYLVSDTTINNGSTVISVKDDDSLSNLQFKPGYYYISDFTQYDLFSLVVAGNDSANRDKFKKTYDGTAAGGYYMDLNDPTCKTKLKEELTNRDIKVQNENDPGVPMLPASIE